MKRQNTGFIPKKLVQLRIISHMTQAELSKELNISRSCLANYETGRKNPCEDIAHHIANYFKVDVGYFYNQHYSMQTHKPTLQKSKDNIIAIASCDTLDLSEISPLSRLALIEFYNFLQEQEYSTDIEE